VFARDRSNAENVIEGDARARGAEEKTPAESKPSRASRHFVVFGA